MFADRARTFSFAARFLPGRERQAAETLYAFCRYVDDLVDEPAPGRSPAEVRSELADWDAWLAGGAPTDQDDPLRAALAETIEAFGLPRDCLRRLIEGQLWDLERRSFTTRRDLEAYCYQVASTVGLAMAHILGAPGPLAGRHAAQLGLAMQLTNILRDVAEDLDRGRVYLSSRELARHRDARAGLVARRTTPGLTAVVGSLARHARQYYAQDRRGIPMLPPACRFPIYLAASLYERILDKIERRECDVFAGRAATGSTEKALLAARALIEVRSWRDALE